MPTGEVVEYAVCVALFFATLLGPSVGVVRRRLLDTQRRRDIAFGLSSAVTGVGGLDTAHRIVRSGGAVPYAYVVGLPIAVFAAVFAASRLGLWQPDLSRSRVRGASGRAKSRVV